MDEVLKIVVMGRACQKYCKHQEPSANRSDVCKGTDEVLPEFYVKIIVRMS